MADLGSRPLVNAQEVPTLKRFEGSVPPMLSAARVVEAEAQPAGERRAALPTVY